MPRVLDLDVLCESTNSLEELVEILEKHQDEDGYVTFTESCGGDFTVEFAEDFEEQLHEGPDTPLCCEDDYPDDIDWEEFEAYESWTEMLSKKKSGSGALTAKARKALPAATFCGPERSFPVPDCDHVRAALGRLGSTTKHRESVPLIRQCILERAKQMKCFKSMREKTRSEAWDGFVELLGEGVPAAELEVFFELWCEAVGPCGKTPRGGGLQDGKGPHGAGRRRSIRCPKCGTVFSGTTCPNCGHVVEATENTSSDNIEPFHQRKVQLKKKRKNLPPGVLARITYKEAQVAGKKNRNQRVYEAADMPLAVREAARAANRGEIFALGGHPARKTPASIPKEPAMSDVSGLIRDVTYNESTGQVGVVRDILNTMPEGQNAAVVLAAGGALPTSSRTRGKVRAETYYKSQFGEVGMHPDEQARRATERLRLRASGAVEIPENLQPPKPFLVISKFQFQGWDDVPGRQSVQGAIFHPRKETRSEGVDNTPVLSESSDQIPNREDIMPLTLKELREQHAEALAELKLEVLTEAAVEASLIEEGEDLTEKLASIATLVEEQAEQIEALTNEKAELAAQVEELGGSIEALQEQYPEAFVEVDPEVMELREQVERLQTVNHFNEMRNSIIEKLKASKHSKFADIMLPLVITESNVPVDDEVMESRVSIVEGFVGAITKRARDINLNPEKAAGNGRVADPVRAEEEQRIDLAEKVGDTEAEDLYFS